MSDLIYSPVGNLQFLAVKNKIKKKPDDEERTVYAVRIEFDGTTDEGKAFKKKIEAVNPLSIGVKNASTPNHFTVQATSYYTVKVTGSDGELLTGDDLPYFSRGSSGRAAMVVTPFKTPKGNSVKLVAVVLKELNIEESTTQEGVVDLLRNKYYNS